MDKDFGILCHIIEHIEDIFHAQKRFGNDLDSFSKDKEYFNAVCMSLLQIGELANHLSDEFVASHTDIPWRIIIAQRNIVVHGYGHLEADVLWDTITHDIPVLCEKCKNIMNTNRNSSVSDIEGINTKAKSNDKTE